MKKILMLMLVAAMLFTGCSKETDNKNDDATNKDEKVQAEETKETGKEPKSNKEENETKADSKPITANFECADELEEIVSADVETTIEALNTEYENLITEVDTYEEYKNNVEKVEAFYGKIRTETSNLCIRLREYAVMYSEYLLASNMSYDEKYDEIDWIYDFLYNDACDEIYDEIYNGLMEDMYDAFYDGVIDGGYNNDSYDYSEVSDLSSEEYELYSDTSSEIYELYSDAQSDIYELYSDLGSDVYDEDLEEANKELAKFKEDVEELKNK